MYELSLISGIVLILTGLITTAFSVYLMVSHGATKGGVHLATSQALATVALGAFQIYGVFAMAGNQFPIGAVATLTNESKVTNTLPLPSGSGGLEDESYFTSSTNLSEELTVTETTVPTERFSTHSADQQGSSTSSPDQFLLNYQKLFNNILNVNRKNHRQPHQLVTSNNCDLESVFFEYAILVYSFMNAVTGLFNSVLKCKTCVVQKPIVDNFIETSRESSFKAILITWLLPTTSLSLLYFIIQNCATEQNFVVNESSGSLRTLIRPLNVTSENTTQLNHIVSNVYAIVHEANTPNFDPKAEIEQFIRNYRRTPKNISECGHTNIPLKLFIFALFIIASFFVIVYALNVRVEIKTLGFSQNDAHDKYLKVNLYGFLVMWLPSVAELFARVYLMDEFPGVASEVSQVFGNLSHIVANAANGVLARSILKQTNAVQPENEQ